MKEHRGMRPQDVVVLIKLLLDPGESAKIKELAEKLYISPSEISESLNRSSIAGLLSHGKRTVNREPFLNFLEHGLKCVFPAQRGPVMKGIFTAHSESSLYLSFSSEDKLVWEDEAGKERGQTILPLYPTVIRAVKKDRALYKILALCDILRIGDSSERNKAMWHIKETLPAPNIIG